MLTETQSVKFKSLLPYVPFKGVSFVDITPLIGDGECFSECIDLLCSRYCKAGDSDNDDDRIAVTHFAGVESRGFIFGAAMAKKLGCGFIAIRKPNKLPGKIISETYNKEYGTDTICVSEGLVNEDSKVVVVDDVLATGGTLIAAVHLMQKCKTNVVDTVVLIDLKELDGSKNLAKENIAYTALLKM